MTARRRHLDRDRRRAVARPSRPAGAPQKYSLSANGKSWTPIGFLYGAGGGFSALFNRPAYQNGVVPANSPPGRAVPDVAWTPTRPPAC